MGGDNVSEGWDIMSNTLLLLGKTGNGKSATGNTILNSKAFKCKASMSGVTSTCELRNTVMEDGRTVNVIDTPGIFSSSQKDELNYKEIMKCIDLAKEGIHAVLLVFTTRCRYTKEEAAALKILQVIFGEKIINYMIIVFSGGDDLEENDVSFDQFIHDCSDFKEALALCEQRVVLFDNRTKDVAKRAQQISQLLSLVHLVVAKNNGQPYFNEQLAGAARDAARLKSKIEELESLLGDGKPDILKLLDSLHKQSDDLLKRFVEILETKLRETREGLEQKLEEETKARMEAEKELESAKQKWEKESRQLQERLEKAWVGCSIQ